jgi:hypothetical protein
MQPLASSKTTSPWTEIFSAPDRPAEQPAQRPTAGTEASNPPAAADLPAEALFDCYNA